MTIGNLAVEALSMSAAAALKGTIGEMAKDAYKALKNKISPWADGDITALERAPESKKRQELLAEEIDKHPPEDLSHIQDLAVALLDELEKRHRTSPIGIDLGRLQAARVRLGEIIVPEGVGLRVSEVVTPGEFSLDKLNVGNPLGKPQR
jgi:hypothetical protein